MRFLNRNTCLKLSLFILSCLTAGLSFAQSFDASDFESIPEGGWPQHWPQPVGASLQQEDGNSFMRMQSQEPGKMLMLYREIRIPEGAEAIEFSWKQRVTGLKRGVQSWFDARIMIEFLDGNRQKVGGKGPTPYQNRDTDGWESKSVKFNLPAGSALIKFMPCLFNVEAGTFDIDDVVFTAIPKLSAEEDPAQQRKLAAAAKIAQARTRALARFEKNGGNLIANGSLEVDSNNDGQPDSWSKPKGDMTYVNEAGNHFLRLQSDSADKMVMHYNKWDIPTGFEALRLSWDWRLTDIKKGKEPWHDARIIIKVMDSHGKQVASGDTYSNRSTDGWQSKSREMLVPKEGVALEFMPTLFNVKSGVMDLDNIKIEPIDAAPLLAAKVKRDAERAFLHADPESPKKENWPSELKVVGNRLQNAAGDEVWLQGSNVPSMEWNPRGENVLKSTQVVTDEWNANVVRLPVKEEYWFGSQGDDYKKLINDVVVMAANRGAYTVLDLHRYRSPRAEHADFWKEAATIYKNHPTVIFDLMNEPHGTSWEVWRNGGFVEEKAKDGDEDAFLSEIEKKYNARGFESIGMQALVDTVRATGARNIVVVGGLDYAYDLSGILNGYAVDDHDGNGVMYSTHVYPWKSEWQKSFLDVAEKYPILVGEVGADAKKMTFMPLEQQEDWETWVPSMLGLIQKYKLNWTAWCFHPSASPRMLKDWTYEPTPFWGQQAKDALLGKQYEFDGKLR
jgi:hypothetical protein